MAFNRVGELIIGKPGQDGLLITDLRFSFSAEKTSSKEANKATVKVYNANPDTIAAMEQVNNLVMVRAGYVDEGGPQTIFTGTACRSFTYQEGPDVITELDLRDSVIPLRDAKISVSAAPNTSAKSVLDLVVANFGLPVRLNIDAVPDKQYQKGFAYNGRVRDAMDKVCNYIGLEWSAQDNEVQIIPKGGTYSRQAVLLNKDTGMIGAPRREAKTMSEKQAAKDGVKYGQRGVTKEVETGRTSTNKKGVTSKLDDRVTLEVQGFSVTSYMNAAIYPGAYLQLESTGVKGDYFRVEDAKYTGDTHGSDWKVEASLRFL